MTKSILPFIVLPFALFFFFITPIILLSNNIIPSCEKNQYGYCISQDEIECRNACLPNKYYYGKVSGIFSKDIECTCGNIEKGDNNE